MLEEGVTSFVLASLAMPWDLLLSYLKSAAAFRGQHYHEDAFSYATTLLGIMIEGTFMNRKFRGCHNASYVHDVVEGDWQGKVEELAKAGGDSLFALNVAPESNPLECQKLIEHARKELGLRVAVGHCQPTGEQLRQAIACGVSYVIHLGNGGTGTSWKKFHRMGMLEEALRNDALHATIIGDGFHISKRYVRDWIHRKDLARSSFVTDRAFAFQVPRDFTVFGISGRCETTPKGSFLRVVGKSDPPIEKLLAPDSTYTFALFGSHASMLQVFQNALNWFARSMEGVSVREHPGYGFHGALKIATALCCKNPAHVAGLEKRIGTIETGYVANCVLLRISDDVKGRKKVAIEKVFVGK